MDINRVDISANKEWNDFLKENYNMFYDYKFISYNDVFEKGIIWHNISVKDKNKTVAIINGCERIREEGKTFISCDGVSFGGFLWSEKMRISDYLQTIKYFRQYLKNNGFKHCILRNAPFIYDANVYEEYEYSLILEGFSVSKYSITNIIDLKNFEFEKLTNPKKRSIQKSENIIDVEIIEEGISEKGLKEYYNILLKNRELKNVKPTHTLKELVYLKNNLNDKIKFFSASINGELAGICILFIIKNDVVLNFYLAADEEHKKFRVSDYLLYKTIDWAKELGYRIYDIGTSNVGNTLLTGLFDFKKKFMANGFLRKTYSTSL